MLFWFGPPPSKRAADRQEEEDAKLRAAARQAVAASGLPPDEELATYRRIDELFRRANRYYNIGAGVFAFASFALMAAIFAAIFQQWHIALLIFTAMLTGVDSAFKCIERSVDYRFQIRREFLTPIRRQLLVRVRQEENLWYAAVVQFPSVWASAPFDPVTSFITPDDFSVMHSKLTQALNRIIDGAEAEGEEVWERLINQEAGLNIPYQDASRLKYSLLPIFPGQDFPDQD